MLGSAEWGQPMKHENISVIYDQHTCPTNPFNPNNSIGQLRQPHNNIINMVADLVEDLLDTKKYNSRTRPSSDQGQPLDIYININVNDISSISEVQMEYSMTLYLRQVWRDERLDYRSFGFNRSITLNHNQYERIWTPDVFIRNLKAGIFHTITVPNRLIRLSPDGTVLYSQRLTLTLACDMELSRYPMDNQTCHIEFGSYAYTTEDLIFNWRKDALPVEMNSRISLPEYIIEGSSHMVCSKKLASTGSFPCLRARFHLTRRLRAYILTTYLPSFLVVLLSWLSFWIDLESAPARTSLSILTILTITTQSSGLLRSMPAGSFTKAIDVWMTTCLVFVFGAFIEYSIVNTLSRRKKRVLSDAGTSQPGSPQPSLQERTPLKNGWSDSSTVVRRDASPLMRPGPAHQAQTEVVYRPENKQPWWRRAFSNEWGPESAFQVEVFARVFFPVAFALFNCVYWPIYYQ